MDAAFDVFLGAAFDVFLGAGLAAAGFDFAAVAAAADGMPAAPSANAVTIASDRIQCPTCPVTTDPPRPRQTPDTECRHILKHTQDQKLARPSSSRQESSRPALGQP
ncbi:MAG: hypothetical protein MUE62_02145 [Burkholderiaceae bacterium]|nr:hypothetical protein [Burkholderiaceae bacterium]